MGIMRNQPNVSKMSVSKKQWAHVCTLASSTRKIIWKNPTKEIYGTPNRLRPRPVKFLPGGKINLPEKFKRKANLPNRVDLKHKWEGRQLALQEYMIDKVDMRKSQTDGERVLSDMMERKSSVALT